MALKDVEVRRRGQLILGPIDFTVRRGQRWVLLGPNGSGKTTLLSVVGARRVPSSGTAEVLGVTFGRGDIRSLHPRIGHASHTLAEMLPADLRVEDVVLTGIRSTLTTWFQAFGREDRARARARLDEVGCGHLAGRQLATCSQGERQRVQLARALVGEPHLLLLDEPAAGLDLPAREALISAIDAAVSGPGGPTLLMATHHLEEIPRDATHALLLREGRTVAGGLIEDTLVPGHLRDCFGMDIRVERNDGRWVARAV